MLKQFCRYNNWANALLLDVLVANSKSLPDSCVSLFSHIVNAQSIWFSRINGHVPNVGVWQVNNLEICKVLLEESVQSLSHIDLMESEEPQIIKYKNSSGDYYETSVSDILLHVFNHGTYHRAQIAKEMKNHDLAPVNTDYIQFVRLHS